MGSLVASGAAPRSGLSEATEWQDTRALKTVPVAQGSRWYAVHALAAREAEAALQLGRQGFEVFLPRRLKTVRHARRMTTQLSPMFPRYLFVRLDPSRQGWYCINGTRGVAHLVSFGGKPAPVPVGVIEALIELSDARQVVRADDLLNPGQSVRLLVGPFADLLGTLSRINDVQSVRVLLAMMGRGVEVTVPRSMVWPV